MFKILLIAFALAFTSQAYSERYIVMLREEGDLERVVNEGIDGRKVVLIRELASINALVVEFTDGLETDGDFEDENIQSIQKDELIQWIDPIEGDDWETDAPQKLTVPCGLHRIGAGPAKLGNGKKVNATVAIIDTGIDAEHKSLNVVQRINFVQGEDDTDFDGHGTHVAGTVAGKNSGNGVVGVAPGARLIALKVLSKNGSGYTSDIAAAIDWVTEHADEIDVVNMSLGGFRNPGFDPMHEAIKKSVDKGVVYVVAAGNSALDIMHHVPAAYPEVMTVSAMVASDGVAGGFGPGTKHGSDDTFAKFSNFSEFTPINNPVVSPGAGIDVAAPGVDVFSTFPGNKFKAYSGTSMASPHVAGTVARYIAENRKTLFPDGIKNSETVYKIRQLFIDHAEPQDEWKDGKLTHDPDSNPEGLIQVIE